MLQRGTCSRVFECVPLAAGSTDELCEENLIFVGQGVIVHLKTTKQVVKINERNKWRASKTTLDVVPQVWRENEN